MFNPYILLGFVVVCVTIYLYGRHAGKKSEKAKQARWESNYKSEQIKQSNIAGKRNAEINSLSTDELAKRASKWVRD